MDLDGNKEFDYSLVDTIYRALSIWLNAGGGGTYQAGDAVMFEDFHGHGKEDYASVSRTGAVTLCFNGNPNSNT